MSYFSCDGDHSVRDSHRWRCKINRVWKLTSMLVLLGWLCTNLAIGHHIPAAHAAPTQITIALSGAKIRESSPAAADFNGDGYKEIVVGGTDGILHVVFQPEDSVKPGDITYAISGTLRPFGDLVRKIASSQDIRLHLIQWSHPEFLFFVNRAELAAVPRTVLSNPYQ